MDRVNPDRGTNQKIVEKVQLFLLSSVLSYINSYYYYWLRLKYNGLRQHELL